MKFCENKPLDSLHKLLSLQDIDGNTGLAYLEDQGFHYTSATNEADFFVSMNGRCLPQFVFNRTVLLITEPYSRYQFYYSDTYKSLFGGFLGISSSNVPSADQFYLEPRDYTQMQELKDQPEYMLGMVHQRYKKQYRNLLGDGERDIAVAFFDRMFGDSFHTYARVWEKTLPWENVGWKGTIKGTIMGNEKLLTLRNYKFTICFENSREDGYITEKIFSALFAGSVPIYFGAPDISTHIPKDCYIEFEGGDYEALYQRMISMTPEQWKTMRDNGRAFLHSEACKGFTSVALAKKLEAHFLRLKDAPSFPFHPSELLRKGRFYWIKSRQKK
ncbi:MAG TPA: glycosyltransferase family 10 [Chroococcidiopsis sp.]